MLHTNLTARAIDHVLAESFPASDPPGWTPGVARPAPKNVGTTADTRAAQEATDGATPSGVIDVSSPAGAGRTFTESVLSLMGVAGLALLAPFAILAVAMPVALGVRGVVEVATRLLAMVA